MSRTEVRCPDCHKLLGVVPGETVYRLVAVPQYSAPTTGVQVRCRCTVVYEIILEPQAA